MKPSNLESIYQEFTPQYLTLNKHLDLKYIKDLSNKIILHASQQYSSLPFPKITDLNTYITYCLRAAFQADQINKTSSSQTNYNSYSKAINNYFQILPPDKDLTYNSLWKTINDDLKNKDEDIIINSHISPLTKSCIKPFAHTIKERNKLPINQKFKTTFDFYSTVIHKIPPQDIKLFFKHKDQAIKYCQTQFSNTKIPARFYPQFNNHYFLCALSKYPQINFPKEILDFATAQYPILNKFRSKIIIELGNISTTTYLHKSDNFLITIRKDYNLRHKTTTLLHELAHVISMLNNFKKGIDPLTNGRYLNELEAAKIEFKLLQIFSPSFHQAIIVNLLETFYSTMFKIEAHKNPNQDLSLLSAKLYKQCYPQFNHIHSYTYLLNHEFITRPFRTLPYSMAYVKLFSKLNKTN